MSIFKMAFDMINEILASWLNEITRIQELITEPLNKMVEQVTGGIWKGDGAVKFTQEMTSEVIPMLASIMAIQTSWADAVRKSQEAMEQAVQNATSQANSLFDVFNSIF